VITRAFAALVGVGAIVALAVGNGWFGLAIVVVAAIVAAADALLAAPIRDVVLRRDGDRRIRLGDTATVALTVTNTGDRTLVADVRDAWVPSAGARFAGTTGIVARIHLDPDESIRLETILDPIRRGDRPAVQVTIRSYGPLRLAYRQTGDARSRAATPPWTLRVLPRFDSRRFLAEKVAKLRVFDGSVVTRGRGQGTEFDALREYVIGDDVRSIDWRGTARRSDVVVRTWRPERDRRIVCVIDTGRTSAVRVGTTAVGVDAIRFGAEPRLDAAIDAALLLGELAGRAGDQVDVLAGDTAIRAAVTGGTSRTLLTRTVSALAPLQPALVETDFGLIVGEVLRRERKRALVVLFTALEPGALGEGLLPVLAQLTARHVVLVAAVADPDVEDLTRRRGTVADVYTAAAAHRALAERRRILAALHRHGVEVVDAPVGAYASAVADTYLRLKAIGRL
jgi:uncharacterized protein (DUF58 family)